MNILDELANKHKTDKGTIGHKYHGYTTYYYEKWKDIRNDVKKVLEIKKIKK